MSNLELTLKVDEPNVDIRLAQDYFKHNKIEPSEKFKRQTYVTGFDGYNKIPLCTELGDPSPPKSSIQNENIHYKLNNLAEAIEKNKVLFCQIDYMIRKNPVDHVQNYDMILFVQNVQRVSTDLNLKPRSYQLLMGNTSPLAALGYVAQILLHHGAAEVISTEKTAAITHLFTKLCHEVGLVTVSAAFVKDFTNLNTRKDVLANSVDYAGCVGVVSSAADVDSAVDTLLQASDQPPWSLSRILVQECIYSKFKMALEWKTREYNDVARDANVKTVCEKFYNYKRKCFFVDYTGADDCSGIIIEAYRTNKELIALFDKIKPMFLSFWTTDVNESKEVAYSVESPPVIWLNEYGVFNGPTDISKAFYDDNSNIPTNIETGILQKYKHWFCSTFEHRYRVISNILINLTFQDENIFLKMLLENINGWNGDDFVRIGNNDQWTVRHVLSHGIVMRYCETDKIYGLTQMIKSLIMGTAFLIENSEYYVLLDLYKKLIDAGVPWVGNQEITIKFDNKVSYYHMNVITKVVYEKFGTIFAN